MRQRETDVDLPAHGRVSTGHASPAPRPHVIAPGVLMVRHGAIGMGGRGVRLMLHPTPLAPHALQAADRLAQGLVPAADRMIIVSRRDL